MPVKKDSGVICRVQNLTSAKGSLLNGLAASFDPAAPAPHPGRVAAFIDGVPDRMSLKLENLQVFREGSYEDLGVSVGRSDLRTKTVNAVVVDNVQEKAVIGQILNNDGSALRSHGSLLILLKYFRSTLLPDRDMVMHVTDLNLALLLNSYAQSKERTLQLEREQQGLAHKLGKRIKSARHDRDILFKYTPYRVHRGDQPPEGMLESVKNAHFHIYPCPLRKNNDALEVRFLIPRGVMHSFFLDFGQEETIQYVKNSFSMDNEMARLKPEVLADVDPQMFWSSVLHSKAALNTLKQIPLCSEELLKEWSDICSSFGKSVASFKAVCFSAAEAVRMLPDDKGKWNLINDQIHSNVALRNAQLALVLGLTVWSDLNAKIPTIYTLDNYMGTDIDATIGKFSQAAAKGDVVGIEKVLRDILHWQKTKTCDYCGAHNKTMFDCSRCQSAGYCSEECQESSWVSHKKVCKSLRKVTKKEDLNDAEDIVEQQLCLLLRRI